MTDSDSGQAAAELAQEPHEGVEEGDDEEEVCVHV